MISEHNFHAPACTDEQGIPITYTHEQHRLNVRQFSRRMAMFQCNLTPTLRMSSARRARWLFRAFVRKRVHVLTGNGRTCICSSLCRMKQTKLITAVNPDKPGNGSCPGASEDAGHGLEPLQGICAQRVLMLIEITKHHFSTLLASRILSWFAPVTVYQTRLVTSNMRLTV